MKTRGRILQCQKSDPPKRDCGFRLHRVFEGGDEEWQGWQLPQKVKTLLTTASLQWKQSGGTSYKLIGARSHGKKPVHSLVANVALLCDPHRDFGEEAPFHQQTENRSLAPGTRPKAFSCTRTACTSKAMRRAGRIKVGAGSAGTLWGSFPAAFEATFIGKSSLLGRYLDCFLGSSRVQLYACGI